MSIDSELDRFFRAIYRDDADTVRSILSKHSQFVSAWATGVCSEKFEGEAFTVKPNDGENSGGTPLHHAGNRNAAKSADVLIEHGVDLEALGFEGNMEWCTPLVLAAF